MPNEDIQNLLAGARELRAVLETVFQEATGEDLSAQNALRHYPLLTLSLTAAAAGLTGWWLGRRSADRFQLFPGTEESRVGPDSPTDLPSNGRQARQLLPQPLMSEEARQAATKWVIDAFEPKLRRNLDVVSEKLDRAISHLLGDDPSGRRESKDVRLDDPD